MPRGRRAGLGAARKGGSQGQRASRADTEAVPPQAHPAAGITLARWLGPLLKALVPLARAPWRAQPLRRPSPKSARR